MRRKATIFLVLVIFLGTLASCATLGINIKSWSAYTPKEKALAILDAYNGQYTDTMSMAMSPNITEAQKVIVRTKKDILWKVYPLIETYINLVATGSFPSAQQEQAILKLLNQLGSKIGG